MTMVLMFLLLAGLVVLSFPLAAWRTKRACDFIVRDLKAKKAFDPASAVELPYSRNKFFLFRMGMRDYRPRALGTLVKFDRVRMEEGNRYYLRDGAEIPSVRK